MKLRFLEPRRETKIGSRIRPLSEVKCLSEANAAFCREVRESEGSRNRSATVIYATVLFCLYSFLFSRPRRKLVLQTEISGNIFNCLSFLVSISSPRREDQFAVFNLSCFQYICLYFLIRTLTELFLDKFILYKYDGMIMFNVHLIAFERKHYEA